jgi:hypothetical protein
MSETAEKKEKTLREKDPAEWKARKIRRQALRAQVRQRCKSRGIKLGRWRGGVAWEKRSDGTPTGMFVAVGNGAKHGKGIRQIGQGTPLDFMMLEVK